LSGRATLRVPDRDGAVVAEPPLGEAGALLGANRRRLRQGRPLLGRPWADLQHRSRRAAVEAACQYLGRRGEPLPAVDPAALLLAGHQPELFHPGVWAKNFALQGLARRHGATSLNLVVDNDTVKTTALRLPAPPPPRSPWPYLATVPFDRWGGEAPYEERAVADPELFAGFGERATALLRGWDYTPLLPSFWAEVMRQAESTPLLGERFAGARRALERAWGCHNLEVPISALDRTEPFAWFACHLLAELPRFHALYNLCVRDYRARHGIRSPTHPVPDLAAEDGWLETPFWGWRAGQARRGRLFARQLPDRLELRAGADPWPALPRPEESRPGPGVAAWQALEGQGFKVRSRALTTTLYARLFLGDLFLHGIGGGKYDELTDELIRRFYGLEPPAYIVLSATRWLPLPAAPVGPEDRRRLIRELRDVHYNPQRRLGELDHDAGLRALAERKQEWIARQPADAAGRRRRFEALRALTAQLRAPLADREHRLREDLGLCERQLRANAVLHRRDYAFCLYPEAVLRPFCTQFL
jgi:hypothetical protein